MSVAHRFGSEGYAVALVSRSSSRHLEYLKALADAGIEAAAFTADASDTDALRAAIDGARARFGRIDVGYYGPATALAIADITTLDAPGATEALLGVVPAGDFASSLLPDLITRGNGGLLFAGGLSSVLPMPALGGLALAAAALRNYALTLHAALAPMGVYSGTLTIGGFDRAGRHSPLRAGSSGHARRYGGGNAEPRRSRGHSVADVHQPNGFRGGRQRPGSVRPSTQPRRLLTASAAEIVTLAISSN